MKKQRKPIDFRGFFKKVTRMAGVGLIGCAVAALGYEMYQFCATRTFLKLEKVEIVNNNRLPREEIIAQGGIRLGDDMMSLKLRRIAELLAKNPWIEEVKVRRYFPGTLRVEVKEREPMAVLNMGYLYYIDGQGDIFKPLNEGDRLDYPIITGITEEDTGKDPNGTKEALGGALQLVTLLKDDKNVNLQDVSEIHYDKGYGFTLFTMKGGVAIRIGKGDFSAKLSRLGRVYQELQANLTGVEYIDLDYPDKIIVKKV
jgi:cell division septal protein FtsQ